MKRELDPVDSALRSLGGQHWPGPDYDPKLEDKLMSSFDSPTQKTSRRFARIRQHPIIAASVAILLVGSVSFAAASGTKVVQEIRDFVGEFFVIQLDNVDLESATYDPETDTYTVKLEASQEDGAAEPTIWMVDENGERIPVDSDCMMWQTEAGADLSEILAQSQQLDPDQEYQTTELHEVTVVVENATPGEETNLVVEVNDAGEVVVEEAKTAEKEAAEEE